MPCYLFTFHAYLSWLPDRKQGYVQRHKGILPPDPGKADQYRRNAKDSPVCFNATIQRIILAETHRSVERSRFRLHAIALDPSHAHILISWNDTRPVKSVRSNLKSSLSRRLNKDLGKRQWFVANASQKRIKDQTHFDHLVHTYLPDHRGLFWSEGKQKS